MIVSTKTQAATERKTAIKVDSLKWHQDCLSVTVLLASSFGPKAMRRLLKRSGYDTESMQDDHELLLAAMHEACHHDPEIRAMVAKELNAKYRTTLAKCKSLGVDEIRCMAMEGPWLIPFMWACFSRDEAPAHRLGRRLAHLAIALGMLQLKQGTMGDAAAEKVDRLNKKNQALRRKLETEGRENQQLRAKLDGMAKRPAMMDTHVQTGISVLRKEVKSLRNQLDAQGDEQKKLRTQLAVWRSLALANVGKTIRDNSGSTSAPNRCWVCCGEPASGEMENSHDCNVFLRCPLQGRKIGIVGGLKRLERGYCEVVRRLGGECLFHSGEMKSGAQGLRQLVDKSDVVVCITSVNSHGAMNTVKKQCKRCQKQFCPLNGAGVSSLENLLLAMAG